MTDKAIFGRVCEDFVAALVTEKTGRHVVNMNDIKNNYPVVDLRVTDPESNEVYEVSIKAKRSRVWPPVNGIRSDDQYIIFVDIYKNESPLFFILSNQDWQDVLREILPKREAGAEIIDGALEWNWSVDGKNKRYRGSELKVGDIKDYVNNWSVLPGA